MSVKIMGELWECVLPQNEQHVLLALADHADHNGENVYPSVGFVAWKLGYSERTVWRVMTELKRRGILVLTAERPGTSNVYRIDLAGVPRKPKYEGRRRSDRYDNLSDPLGAEACADVIPPSDRGMTDCQGGYDTAMSEGVCHSYVIPTVLEPSEEPSCRRDTDYPAPARPRETASERASDESSDDLKTRSIDRILERFEVLTGTRPTAKDRQEAAKLAEAGTPIAAVERGVLAAIDRAKPDRPGSLRYCLRHIAEAARGAAQSAVGAPRESRTPVEAPEVAPAPKIATGGRRTQAATPATTGANALALDAPPLCEVRIDQAYLLREREATRAISSPPPKGEAEYVDRPEYRLAEIAFCARTSFLAAFDRQPNRHELADHVWPLAVEAGIDPGVIERWYPLRPETTYQQHEVAPGRVPANERHGGSVRDATGRRPDGACVESVSTVKGDARDGAPARRIDGGLDETHGLTSQGGFPALALSQPGEGTSTEVLSPAGRIVEFPSPAHAASATVEAGGMAAGLDALAADPFEARQALLREQCAQLLRRESRQEEVGQ